VEICEKECRYCTVMKQVKIYLFGWFPCKFVTIFIHWNEKHARLPIIWTDLKAETFSQWGQRGVIFESRKFRRLKLVNMWRRFLFIFLLLFDFMLILDLLFFFTFFGSIWESVSFVESDDFLKNRSGNLSSLSSSSIVLTCIEIFQYRAWHQLFWNVTNYLDLEWDRRDKFF
jgi:hypothetical protein